MSDVFLIWRNHKYIPAQKSHGPRCLQCGTVEHPSDCGAVTECNLGEVNIVTLSI